MQRGRREPQTNHRPEHKVHGRASGEEKKINRRGKFPVSLTGGEEISEKREALSTGELRQEMVEEG